MSFQGIPNFKCLRNFSLILNISFRQHILLFSIKRRGYRRANLFEFFDSTKTLCSIPKTHPFATREQEVSSTTIKVPYFKQTNKYHNFIDLVENFGFTICLLDYPLDFSKLNSENLVSTVSIKYQQLRTLEHKEQQRTCLNTNNIHLFNLLITIFF